MLELQSDPQRRALEKFSPIASWLGMSKLPLLCNYFHKVMAKFVWSKGNQQSDLGYLTVPILVFTAKNGCKRVI